LVANQPTINDEAVDLVNLLKDRSGGYLPESSGEEGQMNKLIDQKVFAFRKIHADLREIIKHDKCRACTCFHGDILAKVQDTLKRFNESEPEHKLDDIEADFERWTKDVDLLKAHG
jgi:hypothetical protein